MNRYLLKDPLACLASEWLHQEFDMDVVILVRHPAAFVASLRRMAWGFDFNELLTQDELMTDHLAGRREEMMQRHTSLVEVGATLWNCIYAVLSEYAHRNPRMTVVRHEDISNDPETKFRYLYRKLGMEFDDRTIREIRRFTSADNPVDPRRDVQHDLARNSKANVTRWKSILSEEESALVRERTAELARRYYDDGDW